MSIRRLTDSELFHLRGPEGLEAIGDTTMIRRLDAAERESLLRVEDGIPGASGDALPSVGSTADGTTCVSGPEMQEQDSVEGPRFDAGYRAAVVDELLQQPEAV